MSIKKCTLTSTGKRIEVLTAEGRLSYPNLLQPGTQTNPDGSTKERYSTSLLFPVGTDISALEEAIDLAAKAKFGNDYKKKYPKFKLPILAVSDYPAIGVDAEAFPTLIRTSADPQYGKPDVVNMKLAPVTDPGQVYAGRWARITVTVFAYDKAGNRGVSLGLNNVQLLRDDEPLGGGRVKANKQFDVVGTSDNASDVFADNA